MKPYNDEQKKGAKKYAETTEEKANTVRIGAQIIIKCLLVEKTASKKKLLSLLKAQKKILPSWDRLALYIEGAREGALGTKYKIETNYENSTYSLVGEMLKDEAQKRARDKAARAAAVDLDALRLISMPLGLMWTTYVKAGEKSLPDGLSPTLLRRAVDRCLGAFDKAQQKPPKELQFSGTAN